MPVHRQFLRWLGHALRGDPGLSPGIQDQLGIPTRFVGTGEKIDNFAPFDAGEFVAKML